MTLKEFIEKFVCKNTIIRLWTEYKGGHKMIHCGDEEVSMEWQTLKGESFQSAFLDREVIGVTDILCEKHIEAVNIVIK